MLRLIAKQNSAFLEKTKQLTTYRHAYPNLLLTDLFTFVLFRDGKKVATATLANKNTTLAFAG
jgi:hypothetical protein